MNIVELGCRCGTLWFFNLPSAKKLIFSLKFDQYVPNDSAKSLLYKTRILRNSETAGGSGTLEALGTEDNPNPKKHHK